MPEDDVVRIVFGVDGIDKGGASYKQIQQDLETIASKLKINVKVGVESKYYTTELNKLKEEIKKEFGKSYDVKITGDSAKKTLEELYKAKVKLQGIERNGKTESVEYTTTKKRVDELTKSYSEQIAKLKELKDKGEDKENALEKIKNYEKELESSRSGGVREIEFSDFESNIEKARKKIEQLNNAKKTLGKYESDTESPNYKAANSNVAKLTEEYNELAKAIGDFAAKRKSDGVTSDEENAAIDDKIQKLNEYGVALGEVAAKANRATDIDLSKLGNKAESLFTENGFDKIIARSVEAKRLAEDFKAKVTEISKSGKATKTDVANLNAEFINTRTRIQEIGKETNTFGAKVVEAFNTKVVNAFGVAIWTFVLASIKAIYTNVKNLDKALTNLQIATGNTREETAKLLTSYSKLAKQMGATTTEVANSADAWLRQGYTVEETTQLIQESMILSKLGQIDSAEATKALTSAMKGYKIEVQDSMSIVDKFTAVDMQAAVSAGDIATAMAETATSADIAGVSMDKLIGYISSVAETTQDGAESVGTFYKTLFARMGNIKVGNFVDNETGESLNDVEKVLNGVGISLRDSRDNFRDFDQVLDETAASWNSYTNTQKHALATAFAGKLVPVRTEMCV